VIVIVDFDGTLALGLTQVIKDRTPNTPLIKRLWTLKRTLDAEIKIVTARGARGGLTTEQKIARYSEDIEDWLLKYDVPYDSLSYNKEYGSLYIDDLAIGQYEPFTALKTDFVQNKLIFTDNMVIKWTPTAETETQWYKHAYGIVRTPGIHSYNPDMIVMERIHNFDKPSAEQIIELTEKFRQENIPNHSFETYRKGVNANELGSPKTREILKDLPEYEPTFFHGDLSSLNVLVPRETNEPVCIDPSYKGIFGNYLTDAAKAYFSFIAYEKDYPEAKKIENVYGKDLIRFAVAEGVRVCRDRPEYISIVNNIAALL